MRILTAHFLKNDLSLREKQVLALIIEEHTSVSIAAKLHLSVRTVETHRKNIWQKTGSKNLIALTKFAIREGMMEGYSFKKVSHR